jgi:hypothetical protein
MLVTCLYLLAMNVRLRVGYEKELEFTDSNCVLFQTPTPVEDLSSFGDGHCVFGGSGDAWHAVHHGSAGAQDGGIWFINATAGSLRQLTITGSKTPTGIPPRLILHGIYYSQPSRRLYAINHDEELGESVELFDVGAAPALELLHVATVRSPLFHHLALEDVVEGVGNEFFITETSSWAAPTGGRHSANATWRQLAQQRVAQVQPPLI